MNLFRCIKMALNNQNSFFFCLDWEEIGSYAFSTFFLIQICLMKALRDHVELTFKTILWPAPT
jgi:hypothetical protein